MNYLDILLGSIALAGVVWMSSVILAARQRQACAKLLFLAVIDGICGLTNLVLGAGHLTAVVVRALTVEAAHSYDFRRYSLVMVGFLTCAGGLICLLNVGGLLKRSNCAWKNALWASALLVTVNAPLIPPPKLCGSANVGICHKRNRSSVGAAILTSGGKTLRPGTIRQAGLGPPRQTGDATR
jgi:hypothetical protein